jgi:hypothetical protein
VKILVGGTLTLVTVLIAAWFGLAHDPPGACTSTVSSVGAAVTALEGAGSGAVICLSDGTYGAMGLDAARTSEVTLRAEHPGLAHLGAVTFSGPASHYRLSELEIAGVYLTGGESSPHHITIDRNLLQNGAYGLSAASPQFPTPGGCCTTGDTAAITDLAIRNNIFGAVTGEDGLRVDGVTRAQVIHNEFTGVVPPDPDAHTDCIQTVWGGVDLVIERNYFHDNSCQPIFLGKDGDVTNLRIQQNLIVRDREIGPSYEPLSWLLGHNALVRNNTFVGLDPDSPIGTTDLLLWSGTTTYGGGNLPSAAATGLTVDHNVFSRLVLLDYDASPSPSTGIFATPGGVLTENHNVISSVPWSDDRALGTCSVLDETPEFTNPATDDFRVTVTGTGGCGTWKAGVNWRPADQQYGPGS